MAQHDAPHERQGSADRWARDVQLAAVAIAHIIILAFVSALIGLFHADDRIPLLFVVLEALLIVGCGWPLVAGEKLQAIAVNTGLGRTDDSAKTPEQRAAEALRRREAMDLFAGRILIAAFVIQLAALVPLLKETGGPIESPFAPMAIAITVFAPFLANKASTVAFVAAVAATYYVVLVVWLDDINDVWAALAVNLAILGLAAALAWGDLRRRAAHGTLTSFGTAGPDPAPQADEG